jgi:tetratricopeptide (TPR) repeat protein
MNTPRNPADATTVLSEILRRMHTGFLHLLRPDGSFAEPTSQIIDYRPVAEIGKGFLYLGDVEASEKCFTWILNQQKDNGSWHEILSADFDEENSLSTAVIGTCLFDAFKKTKNKRYLEAAKKAAGYLLAREFNPGYIIKTVGHYPLILNLNATAAVLFQSLGSLYKDQRLLAAAERCMFNTVRHQFKDGAYPYTDFSRAFPYEDHMNVRDLYFHALTLFYLLQLHQLLHEQEQRYLTSSIKKGFSWVSTTLSSRGAHWHLSKVPFTVGSLGFYGYAAFCFSHMKRMDLARACFIQLKKQQRHDGLFARYDAPRFFDSLHGIFNELFEWQPIAPPTYSWNTKFFRFKKRCAHDLKYRRNQSASIFYSAQLFNALATCLDTAT